MRKTALTITVSTLVLGVFGAFLRWLQVINIFEPETGLATPGAGLSVALVVFSALAFAAMAVIAVLLRRRTVQSPDVEEAMRVRTPLPRVIAVICAVVFIFAGLEQMFTAGAASSPLMQRIFGAAALVSGAALIVLPCRREGGLHPLARSAALWLPCFFCYWLVLAYRDNAQDPVQWRYLAYLLAIAMTALGYYHLASWYFRRARTGWTLLFLQLAVYLDLCALSDEQGLWLKLMLAAAGVMLAVGEYLLIANFREKPGADEAG